MAATVNVKRKLCQKRDGRCRVVLVVIALITMGILLGESWNTVIAQEKDAMAHTMPAGATAFANPISSRKDAMARFAKLLKTVQAHGLARSFLRPIAGLDPNTDPFRSLVLSAGLLPESLLSSQTPDERGLAAAVIFLGAKRDVLPKHLKLLKDNTRTTIKAFGWEHLLFREEAEIRPWTVAELAATALRARGVHPPGGDMKVDSIAKYLEVTKETEVPHEWIMRMRRYRAWGVDPERIRKEVVGLRRADRAVAMLSIVSECMDKNWEIPFTIVEGAGVLRDGLTVQTMRAMLERNKAVATRGVKGNDVDGYSPEFRRALLYFSADALTKVDATWLHAAADPKEWVSVYYIIAAAKLDPKKGVAWLKKAIKKDSDQARRCDLLEALWQVGGEGQLAYIMDRYFAEMKPAYSAGGLQENLVERLGKSEGAKAAPLLAALIRDKRFRSLSWAPTRAFAKHAELVLGKQTAEVKRYLRVQHRMGRYEFEQCPSLRKEYPVDTKHVLMQTRAFQEYLQAEVTKRVQRN